MQQKSLSILHHIGGLHNLWDGLCQHMKSLILLWRSMGTSYWPRVPRRTCFWSSLMEQQRDCDFSVIGHYPTGYAIFERRLLSSKLADLATTSEGASTVPFPPCGENGHYVSSFFLLNCDPLRWARSLVFCVLLLLPESNPPAAGL